jgi:hypothetical protein
VSSFRSSFNTYFSSNNNNSQQGQQNQQQQQINLSSNSSRSSEDVSQWRERVASVQRSKQTPESIAAAESRAQSKSRLQKNSLKAKRLQTVQAFAKCSNAGTMASLRSASRPASELSFASPNMTATFGDAATAQTREEAAERTTWAAQAMTSLQQAANVEDEEEADGLIEQARVQLQSAGHAWTAFGVEGANEASRVLGNDDDEGGVMNDLLSDLKSEPTNDEDCSRRFLLYEGHTETVATVRKSLLSFWENARADVPAGAAKDSIEASLVNIDHAENLEVYMEPRYWFVYSMAKKVTSNETKLGNVLREIQTKLELLASSEDCPICLESIENKEDEHTFGCAHKVHKECWAHWTAHCTNNHKQPFCPLCRNDEFLEDILQG